MTTPPPSRLDPADAEYQSLAPLAAIALLLGICSPAALASPLLVLVPAAAALSGVLALAKIRAAGGALTGDALARWGVALAVGSGVAALVRTPARDALVHRQADRVAQQWLALVAEDRTAGALALLGASALQSLGPQQPGGPGGPEPPPTDPPDLRSMITAKLRGDVLARRLAELRPPLRVAREPGGAAPMYDGLRTIVVANYEVAASGAPKPLRVELRLERAAHYEASGQPWRVASWRLLDVAPEASDPHAGHSHR